MKSRPEAVSEAPKVQLPVPDPPKTPALPVVTVPPADAEAVYTVAELKDAAVEAFGERPEVVAGALKLAGKDAMTRTEAKAAIRTFLSRRV